MNSNNDKTKQELKNILSELYKRQSKKSAINDGSYLIAQDGQFLGKITSNKYDNDSILNPYGPYGSKYSPTSIFNPYSTYGSQYGNFSTNNPYASSPRLFVNGVFKMHIGVNKYEIPRISPEVFIFNLNNNLQGLLSGNILESESHLRNINKESYIEASDGTFLGYLDPNEFNPKSIFNKFGTYGNEFSSISIFNQYSPYGNPFSQLSVNNEFTQKPPKIILRGEFIAYLTTNEYLQPRIAPDEILDWARNNY